MGKNAQKLSSHTSRINNKRIIKHLERCDGLMERATNTKSYQAITEYYNKLETVYVNVKDILPDAVFRVTEENDDGEDVVVDGIEKTRENYRYVLSVISEGNQGIKPLRYLLRYAKRYHSQLITGLQQKQFFYRQETPKTRLSDISFGEENVFDEGMNK